MTTAIAELATKEQTASYSVLEVAKSYTIDSAPMAEMAADELISIKVKQKELDEKRKSYTRPLDEQKKEIMGLFEPAVTLLNDAETVLKGALKVWQGKEQIRIAQEQKAQREELARQQREAAKQEQETREAAAKAEAAGDTAKAADLNMQADTKAAVAEVLQYAPPVSVAPTKLAGISTRETWKAEVVDLFALVKAVAEGKASIELLQANQVAINKRAVALKSEFVVPGIRVYSENNIAASSRR